MFIYGLVDVSLDPTDERVGEAVADDIVELASDLLADGANGLELRVLPVSGGPDASPRDVPSNSLDDIVPALVTLGVPVSIDTVVPEVARRALEHGATTFNAVCPPGSDEIWHVAADVDVPIVIGFAPGPGTPAAATHVDELIGRLDATLALADRAGCRHRCIVDPGPALTRADRPSERLAVLDAVRRFELPLSIVLPNEDESWHDDLLEVVLEHGVEFGRAADPSAIRRFQQRRVG